jgi:gliding motility-associated-like protein
MKIFYSFLFLVSFFALTSQQKNDKLARELKAKQEANQRNHEHKTCGFKGQMVFDKDSLIGFDEAIEWQKSMSLGYNIADKTIAIARAKRNYIDFKYGYKTLYTGGANQVQSGCSNVDFEAGNTSGWTAIEGDNINSTTYQMGPSIATTQAAICAPGYVDPNAIPITGTSPLGGNFLRLGKTSLGGTAYKLSQTFTVTPANSVFIYAYAVVLENGSHLCSEQPYFNIRFKDCSGNLIPCSDYDVIPYSTSCTSGDNSFLTAANGFRYKNWTTKSFDLTSYIGQCVSIDFQVAGCVILQGAHTGYCYVDAACKPMSLNLNGIDIPVGQVNNNFCQGATNTLCAPIGFNAYNWTGPSGFTSTSQCIIPPANGSGTYSVSLTMAGTSCTNPVLYSSFNFTPAQTSNFSYSALPCQNSLAVPFTSTVNLNGGPAVTYNWDFNNDGVVDNTSASPTFTYPAYGTYTAQLQVSNGACLNTLSQVVSIQPTPTVSATSIAPICPATCTQLLGQAYQSAASSVTTTPSFTNSSSVTINDNTTVSSTINTSGLTSATLTSICFNINHTWDADLDITLVCPGGGSLLLTADNGGSNPNYTNTCFNLTSAQVITAGTAPFNSAAGYIPQGGALSALNNCIMNGAWQLQVADDAFGDTGTLLNWTLNFKNVVTTTGTVVASSYTWSPNTSMTGGSSLTPTVCPTAPTIYTLSATNAANGCVATTTVQVQPAVGAPTLAVTSNSIALNCTTPVETVTVSATPATDLTYVWNVAPATLSAGNSIATFTNAGNYICTVTNTVTNCVSTIPVAVSNNTTIPVSTASTAGILTCNNFSVALNSTLAGMNYTWSAPSGGSVVSASTQSTSANGVGDYTLSIFNPANGCSYTTTTTVLQNTIAPVLSAGSSPTLSCISPTVTLNGSVSSPTNATVLWTGGTLCGTTTNAVTQACSPGVYTLTATDPLNSCVSSSTVEVFQNIGVPTPSASSTALLLNCSNPVQSVTVTSTPSADVLFSWTGSPSNLNANNTVATFSNVGTYVCTLTNTLSSCTSTIQISVTNNTAIPTSTASTLGILTCTNLAVSLNSTLAGMNYTWTAPSGGSVLSASTQSTSANGVGNYTLTIIDPTNGCTYTTTTSVTQNTATPVLSAGPNQTLTCASPSVTLSGTVTTPANPSLIWTGGVCGTTTNVATEACTAGIYTLTATDPLNGCVNSSTVEVYPNLGAPTVNISSNSLVLTCVTLSQSVTVTSVPNTGVTYSWSATPATQSSGGAVATFTSNGTYVCTVTNTTTNCPATTQVIVTTNNTAPTINITPTQTITCANPTAVITLTTLPTSGITYTWSPNPVSGQGSNSVVVNQANIYSVTVTDAINGCTNTATSQIIANGNIPAASISATSSNSIITCSNPSVTLTASVTPSAAYSYTWLPSGNGSAITVNSVNIYTVVVLNTVTGCTTFATYNVLSNTVPPNIVADDIIMPCYSNTANVIATSTNAVSYNWTTTNGSLLTNGTSIAQVGSTGVYNVTATDLNNGCVSTDLATVTQTFITGGLGANPLSGTSPLLVNFTNQSGGAYNYSWTFGDNNNNTSSSTDPTHTFTATGIYVVTLLTTDATGLCSITSTIAIEVLDNSLLEVPNVFTPNGDGSNDVFSIRTKGISELKCEIYNRWGLKLYTISSPVDYWDGGGYSAGTYFYILEAKGADAKEYKQQGFISLFK